MIKNYHSFFSTYWLYIKSSLTGNERDYLLDHHKQHNVFPHITSTDRFFSEAQFEAYRALGEHIGEDLLHPELTKGTQVSDIKTLFTALASNLLTD